MTRRIPKAARNKKDRGCGRKGGYMLFIAFLGALAAVVLIEYLVYKKYIFKGIQYEASLSETEVFEGDEIYLYEEITNSKKLPIPYIKIDSDLPDGLEYCLFDEKGKSKKLTYTSHMQSVFVLRPGVTVKRRWRVRCVTRGDYRLGSVIAVSGDLLGLYTGTLRLECEEKRSTIITVLPRPVDLAGEFASSRYLCGDLITNMCPVTDPLRICGIREYEYGDPMNSVNWKASAVHDKIMVNIREHTVRHQFNIVLNMNSREIEQYPDKPSDIKAVEKCINVVASILDRVAAEEIPIRIFTNNPCRDNPNFSPVTDDGDGLKIMKSECFKGRRDMLVALRTLSSLKAEISLPAEKMLDHITKYPELYRESENLVIVSSYLDERLLNLYKIMRGVGVNVIYYITTTRREAVLPEDVDIYFRAY